MQKFESCEQLKEMSEILARHWMTKKEIMSMFNFSDERPARRSIEKIAREMPVISSSKRAGYKVASEFDETYLLEETDREL